MSEQEQRHTPEDTNHQTAELVDVMSLKKVEMTTDEYKYYGDLYPDDPQLAEWLQRNGVVPGESIIVSATDKERPENNFSLVIATGEDSFTTNRALTIELEARLLENDVDVERIVLKGDIEELGEAALSAMGVDAPDTAEREHDTSERALTEAKSAFDQQLKSLIDEYTGASNFHKQEIKANAEDLSGTQRRLEEVSEAAFRYLRSGMDQPDRIRQSVALAFEELENANAIIGGTLAATENGRTAANNLNGQTEAHIGEVRRLHGELRATIGAIVDTVPASDRAQLGQIDMEAREMTVRQTIDADRLEDATTAIRSALSQLNDDMDMAQRRTRNLLGQLEEIKAKVNYGQLSSSEYESVVRSAHGLLQNIQESTAVRHFVSLAEEL